jgi:hypothetical protein
MKPAVALSHWWLRCALHHAETRLCISLPFFISFIANIARKRPELNRDKTKHLENATYMTFKILTHTDQPLAGTNENAHAL